MLGEKTDLTLLRDFFEAVIKYTLSSGGSVFSSFNRKAVLIWTWHGADPEVKKLWHEVLGPEGVKRYYWLYEKGNVAIEPAKLAKSILPDYMGVMPGSQGHGYGGHLIKWSFDYFAELGFEVPFIMPSSTGSAKLYGPLIGFHEHKVVFRKEGDTEPLAIFMKRNKPE